jgi:general nucleoside transport system permease protein
MADFFVNWIASAPGTATPYALAALGLIISERAGVLSLAAEGFMLVGALSGIAACLTISTNPIVILATAMAVTAALSIPYAVLVVALRINQVIAGLAFVFLSQGLTALVGTMAGWTNRVVQGLPKLPLWPLTEIPAIGRIFADQDVVVLLVVPLFLAVWLTINRSLVGLQLRAVGENPDAADAAGVNVARYRLGAVIVGSAIVGLGGAYLSVVSTKIWIPGMTNGRGWIAVALVIFSRWRPWRALAGALLFGSIEALIPRIAAAGLPVPQYYMLMSPYVATILVMILVGTYKGRRSGQPGALGEPYVREERR